MLGSRPLEATPKALSNDAEGRTTDIEKNAIVDNIAATPNRLMAPPQQTRVLHEQQQIDIPQKWGARTH